MAERGGVGPSAEHLLRFCARPPFAEGFCDTQAKPCSHDTSRTSLGETDGPGGEDFSLECPNCGGDIRLIAFITEPGPLRKILTHVSEPLEPQPISPARGPPTDWGELVQVHF